MGTWEEQHGRLAPQLCHHACQVLPRQRRDRTACICSSQRTSLSNQDQHKRPVTIILQGVPTCAGAAREVDLLDRRMMKIKNDDENDDA
jgi:hypothetical protein